MTRRQYFTLLELMVVMAIIALVSGIVVISVNKALISQRFRTEVSLIVDELRLAQDLMMILGTDVHVLFEEDTSRDGINYWIELETKLPENISREVLRKHKKLKIIRGAFFEGDQRGENVEGKLDLKFLSNGAVMSQGILKLSSSADEHLEKGVLENFICFAGYPKPIFSTESKMIAEQSCGNLFNDDFDVKITQDTISRLPDKIKQTEEEQAKPKEGETKDTTKPKTPIPANILNKNEKK